MQGVKHRRAITTIVVFDMGQCTLVEWIVKTFVNVGGAHPANILVDRDEVVAIAVAWERSDYPRSERKAVGSHIYLRGVHQAVFTELNPKSVVVRLLKDEL